MPPLEDVTVTVEVVGLDEDRAAGAPGDAREPVVGPVAADDDVVRLEHVAKAFGPVVALRDVNLHLRGGEALGVVGDNASGKSTLVKILAGFERPDAGRTIVHGVPLELRGVGHARALGVDCVFQDLALVDQLSVWQNLFLRREEVHRPVPLLARRRMRAAARAALDDLGVRVASVDAPVGWLSGGQRQAVAVARSVRSGARILLLDEPIAAMGAKESVAVLDVLARLREQSDVSILLVAHAFAHVLELCDRVCLLEDGGIALDAPTAETSASELARRMLPMRRPLGPAPA